jgi:glycosyltransferase involved in cell wall biosynthesis
MGPDPGIGGGMAASLAALLVSPLAERYRLDVIPTYRGQQPLQRLLVYCAALLRLLGWRLRGRGRIVHIHATVRGSAYRKAVCVLVAKALGCRVVLQIHSGPGDVAKFRHRLGRARLGLLRAAIGAADVVLAVSAASARALYEAGAPGEIGVVPNAAPPVVEDEKEGSASGEVQALYLGGFANPIKGGEVLVEALETATAAEPRLRATLAGPGEPPPSLAALSAATPAVAWSGWLDPDEKAELLRSTEIFLMPSLSEGLPMALLEAMAHGIAIVATEVGGVPEVLEDGVEGLLVAPDDPGAIAEALGRLVADAGLRDRLGAAARERARWPAASARSTPASAPELALPAAPPARPGRAPAPAARTPCPGPGSRRARWPAPPCPRAPGPSPAPPAPASARPGARRRARRGRSGGARRGACGPPGWSRGSSRRRRG